MSHSNIKVSVHFKQSTVFAGEDVECVIIFKNTATFGDLPTPSQPPSLLSKRRPSVSRHTSTPVTAKKGHGRSLSILSIGDRAREPDGGPRSAASRGHSRSTSMKNDRRGLNVSSPLPKNSPPAPISTRQLRSNSLRSTSGTQAASKRSPSLLQQEFRFPPTPSDDASVSDPYQPEPEPDSAVSPYTKFPPRKQNSPRPLPDPPPGPSSESHLNPISRLINESSTAGTPRSSLDLYSHSNHSDETLASEYPIQPFVRQPIRNVPFRRASRVAEEEEPAGPETLMMGYAQVGGSFTLDGSLVNQGPFEEVKRKGVVGGQGGGGVVGIERKKRESGLLGAFGWSSIGDSLGELLGGNELSSLKEMRTIANSKSIPLLGTPPSILFVDLQLGPGESKQYSYSFKLPKGLPPTHKGRAMKVSYQISIGIQRPGPGASQKVRSIEVPFRVFGAVNPRGDSLAHDLLSPYIYLRDEANTKLVDGQSEKPEQESDLTSFLTYANVLLQQTSASPSGLLSPTVPLSPHLRRASSVSEPANSREAIDLAILRSTQKSPLPGIDQKNLSSRFSISRSSRPVATLLFARTAYRLGETIHMVVDAVPPPPTAVKSNGADASDQTPIQAPIPVYFILVTLETSEAVDPAISLRSAQSVHRQTRRIHASTAESALFSKRLAFALPIPPSATPEFDTSGIKLEWRVRVEFITPRVWREDEYDEPLLGEVAADERGMVLQGRERMAVESFEVAVPIKVFGAIVGGRGENDVEDMSI